MYILFSLCPNPIERARRLKQNLYGKFIIQIKIYQVDIKQRKCFFKFITLKFSVNGKSVQNDNTNQNGNSIRKEKTSEDIEVIMLSKQVRLEEEIK